MHFLKPSSRKSPSQSCGVSEDTHQKEAAAQNSVIAAFLLTTMKIIVGVLTGSLGILAEAAHSALDLLAAMMTQVAVRYSGKPADREHLYGHGKAENLSALFETLLLLITCVWIVYAATKRILAHEVEMEVNAWSFGIMFVSIWVDVTRSRMLFRAAKKFKSQALEVDALHFSTDIWSSLVVVLGLFCVKLHEWLGRFEFLRYADAFAAIVVGLIVIKVCFGMGRRAISELLDTAPDGIEHKVVEIVEKLPGTINCHKVRIRCSGAQLFIDLHVLVQGEQSLRQAHAFTEVIEEAIRKEIPNADITVHPEPGETNEASENLP